MSLPLKDLRAKVTPETWCVLQARARATGLDYSEIVRDVLHRWAAMEMRTASLLPRLLATEGLEWTAGGAQGRNGE